MTLDSQPKRWPKLLIVALAIYACVLVVLWRHGFPRTTSDSVTFKQAAYMRLHTDFFSIPTYRGLTEYVDVIYSYPSPVYILFNYVVFKTLGFGLFTSLAADLAVHFLLVALAAWSFWRVTGNSALAALLVLGMASLYDPIGRPEEFGLLLALAALIFAAAERSRLWLTIACLGLCGATTPGTAIAGTAQVLVLHALVMGLSREFWRRAALIAVLSPAISLAIYFWYISPYTAEGLWQLQHTVGLAVKESLLPMLERDLLWSAFVTLAGLAAIGAAVYVVAARPAWLPEQSPVRCMVMAMSAGLAVNLAFNLAAGRPQYDYRFASLESLGILALVFNAWLQSAPVRRPMVAAICALGLTVLCVLPNRDAARYLLASLLWKPDAVTYEQAVAKIQAVVPHDASIGGDSAVWMAIGDGRPFYSIRWVGLNHWPDYIVTTQWTKIPYVFQVGQWRRQLEQSYEEVSASESANGESCSCEIAGWKLPLATGRCDWDVRIWKRRASAQKTSARPSEAAPSPREAKPSASSSDLG